MDDSDDDDDDDDDRDRDCDRDDLDHDDHQEHGIHNHQITVNISCWASFPRSYYKHVDALIIMSILHRIVALQWFFQLSLRVSLCGSIWQSQTARVWLNAINMRFVEQKTDTRKVGRQITSTWAGNSHLIYPISKSKSSWNSAGEAITNRKHMISLEKHLNMIWSSILSQVFRLAICTLEMCQVDMQIFLTNFRNCPL